tara:strand:- start:6447 stop:7814 length:1368 start_codon:yes stop_codon:yes gene_type:complete
MEYLSTRNNKLRESFTDILFQGLSNDGGLYLPKEWPVIDIKTLKNKTYPEVAFDIIKPYVGGTIANDVLYEIINKTYKKFTHHKIAPLKKIDSQKYILELFYGPTLAFKDYALQFLGNLFAHLILENKKKITILGATSGDTGSAAIEAFKGNENINVFILHPYNKVSEVQRRQMSTVTDKNIFNVAVDGTFDDCQNIVKGLFVDEELQNQTSLTAINSINWARLIAQTVYYFWAYLQLGEDKISFIVPSGNFGNIFSAHVAQKMGLPINELRIVTNQNDILDQIITTGQMRLSSVIQSYSPSMDIQVSSNFERQIFESVDRDSSQVKNIMNEFVKNKKYNFSEKVHGNLKEIYSSCSVSNQRTLETIKKFKNQYNYLADPHTATGLSLLETLSSDHSFVSLACAHPAKFTDVIELAIGERPTFPSELENIFDKKEKMTILPNSSKKIKSLILNNI